MTTWHTLWPQAPWSGVTEVCGRTVRTLTGGSEGNRYPSGRHGFWGVGRGILALGGGTGAVLHVAAAAAAATWAGVHALTLCFLVYMHDMVIMGGNLLPG